MLNTPFQSFLLKAVTVSTKTVLSSNSFHKSTTLALKNFCPNVPFLFLNNMYLCNIVINDNCCPISWNSLSLEILLLSKSNFPLFYKLIKPELYRLVGLEAPPNRFLQGVLQ